MSLFFLRVRPIFNGPELTSAVRVSIETCSSLGSVSSDIAREGEAEEAEVEEEVEEEREREEAAVRNRPQNNTTEKTAVCDSSNGGRIITIWEVSKVKDSVCSATVFSQCAV